MNELEEKTTEMMADQFLELVAIHVPQILKRAHQFTSDDETLSVTFKFGITNTGRVVKISPSFSMPGQKVTDGGAIKVIDLDQPDLPKKK